MLLNDKVNSAMSLEELVRSQRDEIEILKRKVDVLIRTLDGVLLWNEKALEALVERVKISNDKKEDIEELTKHLKNTLGRI